MSVSFPRFIGLCLVGSLLFACSESTEDDDGNRPSSSSGAGAGSSTGVGAGGPGSGGGPGAGGTGSGAAGGGPGSGGAGSGGAPGTADVVINEVSASGDDYVELYNAGTAAFDLGGFGVCDTDGDMPKIAEATRFEAGTMLAPGAFLVIVADLDTAEPGPQTECLAGAVASCYHATWGISAGDGENIYLLDEADAIVGQEAYAPDAVPAGQTIGRIPDGEGALVPNAPTPGAANAAP